jgi:hypothetical protein
MRKKREFCAAFCGGDVLLVLWHALPRSEYSVESISGWPAALNGLVGREKKFFVGCERREGGVGARSAFWRGAVAHGFPDAGNFRGVNRLGAFP